MKKYDVEVSETAKKDLERIILIIIKKLSNKK